MLLYPSSYSRRPITACGRLMSHFPELACCVCINYLGELGLDSWSTHLRCLYCNCSFNELNSTSCVIIIILIHVQVPPCSLAAQTNISYKTAKLKPSNDLSTNGMRVKWTLTGKKTSPGNSCFCNASKLTNGQH